MRQHTLYIIFRSAILATIVTYHTSLLVKKGEKASGLQPQQLGSREKEAGEQHQDPELSREIPHFDQRLPEV